MWILPNNHPLYSAFAQECVDSKEQLKEHVGNLVGSDQLPQLMWKSKHSSSTTWLSRWSKVYWIRHLFGRTLKPSTESLFMEKYTASLPVIHASHSALQGKEGELMIHGTFGRLYRRSLELYDLFSASSKTCQDTSLWDLTKFIEAFQNWIILLRQESLQRRKLALHMNAKGSSSSHWKTPCASEGTGGEKIGEKYYNADNPQYKLRDQVHNPEWKKMNWPTMTIISGSEHEMANAISERIQGGESKGQGGLGQLNYSGKWPATPGEDQYEWEAPRIESKMGFTVNGYNFREDLLRMAGNGVLEQQGEVAFIELLKKFL